MRTVGTFFSHACGPDVDKSSELRTWAPVDPVKKPGTMLDWAQASTFQTHATLHSAAKATTPSESSGTGMKSELHSYERTYLLLCAIEHADGLDVVGVLSQSPLSFHSFIHSLTDVHRLRGESRCTTDTDTDTITPPRLSLRHQQR